MNNTKAGATRTLPLIPMRGLVVFPGTTLSFDIGRPESIESLRSAMTKDRQVLLLTQHNALEMNPANADLYRIGTLVEIRQILEMGEMRFKVVAEGLYRAKATRISRRGGLPVATIERLDTEEIPELESNMIEAGRRSLVDLFEHFAMLSGSVSPDTVNQVRAEKNVWLQMDVVTTNLSLQIHEKQGQLEHLQAWPRLSELLVFLTREVELAKLSQEIDHKVRDAMDKNQREYFLNEQMRTIQAELGDDEQTELEELRAQLQKSGMPQEYKDKISKEIDRFARMPENFPETSVQRNWLQLLLEMPFGRCDNEVLDLAKARSVLDHDHYGMTKVKERILEYLAVRKLVLASGDSSIHGPILCFVGPPGVGKTSIARSIAEALGRKYVRMSLGGVHDEAEIRGHRRTYVGAMPGRIIQGIRHVGTDNPLFLLDEIDKLGSDFRGDPSAALLEVLDPEQNNNFRDHYIEIPYDLSKVLFITTANSAYEIPEPLMDRMELIEISGYTEEEKVEIARRHLLPKQMKIHGLQASQMTVTRSAMANLIAWYTREAGVRQLERELAHLCRVVAVQIADKGIQNLKVQPKDLEKLIGRRRFSYDLAEKKDQVGCATGLAWTSSGGDTLAIEVNVVPGNGKLELTGQLGDVMKESARAAYSYIRSRSKYLNLDEATFDKSDIHIHVPAGAVPKDGPSAGITLATALASALTGVPVRHDLAMTGEITLRGRVLPIGGLKEKAVAARRAGIKVILIPAENQRDVDDIPETVRTNLEIIPVSEMDAVLNLALQIDGKSVFGAAPKFKKVAAPLKKLGGSKPSPKQPTAEAQSRPGAETPLE